MPNYTYSCPKCGAERVEFHGMNDAPRVRCDACGSRCDKLFGTGGGFKFVGDGFYANERRKDKEQITVKDKKSGTKRRVK